MTKIQSYIILSIIVVAIIFFLRGRGVKSDLPNSVGDPLELVIIKDPGFDSKFYNFIKKSLSVDIGPSPQPENLLRITEIDSKDFTGLFKRHQNLLLVVPSESFQIDFKKDLFATNQMVIVLMCPSYVSLIENIHHINNIPNHIKRVEINRLIKGFKTNANQALKQIIEQTHNISMFIPKGFFLAYKDSSVIWARRETPKMSQGIFITKIPELNNLNFTSTYFKKYIDSIISPHILGPLDESHMITEKNAIFQLDSLFINHIPALKLQSLWRMKKDFMGGTYVCYIFQSSQESSSKLIYTYLYAPNQSKSIPLLQLEAVINTIQEFKTHN